MQLMHINTSRAIINRNSVESVVNLFLFFFCFTHRAFKMEGFVKISCAYYLCYLRVSLCDSLYCFSPGAVDLRLAWVAFAVGESLYSFLYYYRCLGFHSCQNRFRFIQSYCCYSHI